MVRYWNSYVGADGKWRRDRPPGEDLAAMRAGLGCGAGEVPQLWPFYTCEIDDRLARRSEVSAEQKAEHAALAMYGLHQQSQDRPMHKPGVTLGRALRALRQNDKFSEDAVDRRVSAAVSSTTSSALLGRLRGLITQLRGIGQPLDYDLLLDLIADWEHPEDRQRARRKLGLDYHSWGTAQPADQPDSQL